MNENENLVTEEVTENVEQTTEETPAKTFTQDELNDIVGKAKARERAKITKQYERQNSEYQELIETLETGTGKKGVKELNDTFTKFYEGKGVPMPKKAEYSEKDIELLASAEADKIIKGGYEDVVDEVDRLTEVGVANMTAREKALFKKLAEHRQNAEKVNELAQIGVTEEVYNSKEFQEYAGMFKESTPITKIYENYQKTQPKKDYKIPGSMKNTETDDRDKDYYSFEEASKFTKEDFDKDPTLFKKVKASMSRWKR